MDTISPERETEGFRGLRESLDELFATLDAQEEAQGDGIVLYANQDIVDRLNGVAQEQKTFTRWQRVRRFVALRLYDVSQWLERLSDTVHPSRYF